MKQSRFTIILPVALLAFAGCKPAAQPAEKAADSATPPLLVPAPKAADVQASPAQQKPHREYWPFLRARIGADARAKVATAETDLNGDGHPEILAYVYGPGLCGSGGCKLMVLQREESDWRLVMDSSVTQLPVRLLESRSHGWHDLSVGISGGGAPARQARMQFDGKRYPSNPTMQPEPGAVEATILIPEGVEGEVLPG